MSKVASVIQETMQKGRAIVSDRKLGKESYARLGDIYEEGFDRIGEIVTQSGEAPELSASWVKASSEIAKLRKESPPDAKMVLRRYELFFKEATQLAGGMIGGSVGEGVQGVSIPILAENSNSWIRFSNLPLQFDFQVTDTPDNGLRIEFDPKGKSFREIAELINEESQRLWNEDAIAPRLLQEPLMDAIHKEKIVLYPILKGSNGMTWPEQKIYLESKGMRSADPTSLCIAAGFYRLQNRFSSRADTERADWYKGQASRPADCGLYYFINRKYDRSSYASWGAFNIYVAASP